MKRTGVKTCPRLNHGSVVWALNVGHYLLYTLYVRLRVPRITKKA